MDCSLSGPSAHGILQARILECVAFPFSRDLPNSGIEPRSPTLQEDPLAAEPPGKPKNTGVSNLFLHQPISPTQESKGVSCIAGRFFTSYSEALYDISNS